MIGVRAGAEGIASKMLHTHMEIVSGLLSMYYELVSLDGQHANM